MNEFRNEFLHVLVNRYQLRELRNDSAIHSFVRSFVRSFVHSFIHPFIHLLIVAPLLHLPLSAVRNRDCQDVDSDFMTICKTVS